MTAKLETIKTDAWHRFFPTRIAHSEKAITAYKCSLKIIRLCIMPTIQVMWSLSSLALLRLLAMAVFVPLSFIAGFILCLVRPFHGDNVRVIGSWYAKMPKLLGECCY